MSKSAKIGCLSEASDSGRAGQLNNIAEI